VLQTKVVDRREVRVLACRQHPKRNVLVGCTLDLLDEKTPTA